LTAHPIIKGLYVIPVGPVNTFLLDAKDGCVLIDTGFPNSAKSVLRAIGKLGKRASDIRHIVLTHAHPDHIGSAGALKRATGAEVYAPSVDEAIIARGTGFRRMFPAPGLRNQMLFRMFIGRVQAVEPVRIEHQVDGGQVLPIAGGIKAVPAAGHCAGQLAFLWPQDGGVLFAADACANMMGLDWSVGYEDIEEGRRTLKRLADLQFQTACFGHGKAIIRDAAGKFRKKWLEGN
jgi:glyoxylase-like metal-dependent hydrolase (beta-lactamase superfamily II)